jgi:lactate dehydrogenase-like 2-hydroxyacid dehydrogenase
VRHGNGKIQGTGNQAHTRRRLGLLAPLRYRAEPPRPAHDQAELLASAADKDGVLCLLTDKIDAEFFDAAPKVQGLANYAVGFDNLDVAEATRRRIPLSNTPDVLTDATADMAWALLFAVASRVVESDAVMRSGSWPGWGPMQFIGGDITGATLGIVGAGRIGAAMAAKSKGFGMTRAVHRRQAQRSLREGSRCPVC